jgi:hypothetical protein
LRLAEFDIEVQHRPGTKIKHVDALSRHVQTVTTSQTLSKYFVRVEQETDKFCNTIEVGELKGKSEYFMMKRESFTGDERTGNTSLWSPRA